MILTWFLFLFHLEATCLAQILNKLRNQHIIIYFLTILTRNLYVILKCTKGCVVFYYLRVCEQKPLKAAAVKGLQCKVVQPGPTNSGLWKVFRSWNWTFWSFHRVFFDPKWQPMPVEFGSRMLGSSHFSEFCLGGMIQGSLRDVAGSQLFPPEHCLGALPNLKLNPLGCPSQVGLGLLGDTKKSDTSDLQITPASCQEAPLTAPPWPMLRGGTGLPHIPAASF